MAIVRSLIGKQELLLEPEVGNEGGGIASRFFFLGLTIAIPIGRSGMLCAFAKLSGKLTVQAIAASDGAGKNLFT